MVTKLQSHPVNDPGMAQQGDEQLLRLQDALATAALDNLGVTAIPGRLRILAKQVPRTTL